MKTDFGLIPDLTYPACTYNWIARVWVSLTSKLIILKPSCFAFNSAFSKTALARPNPLAQDAKKKVLKTQEWDWASLFFAGLINWADPATTSVAVPIYQTTSYQFKNAETAANLFGLKIRLI